MYCNVSSAIWDGEASGPSVRRRRDFHPAVLKMGLQLLATTALDGPRLPAVVSFTESRMREICMSGSTRGEWIGPLQGVVLSPTLPERLRLSLEFVHL